MKSYTDIEQSKKLAEILPLKSADMRFCFSHTLGGRTIGHYPMIGREPSTGTIPCWSLAALLDVLPKYIGDYGKCLYYDMGYYYCGYMVDGDFMLTIEETKADNPIDACYEMIVLLHKENLI